MSFPFILYKIEQYLSDPSDNIFCLFFIYILRVPRTHWLARVLPAFLLILFKIIIVRAGTFIYAHVSPRYYNRVNLKISRTTVRIITIVRVIINECFPAIKIN